MAHRLKKVFAAIKKGELTKEEEDRWDNLEDEVVIPAFKWSIIGFFLIFCLTKFAIDLISVAMIMLSLYLVYGLLRFVSGSNRQAEILKQQIVKKKILFKTDMGSVMKNRFLVIGLACVFCLTYTVVGIHKYAGFSEFLLRIKKIWDSLVPTTQFDLIALLFSAIISAIAILISIMKVVQISNLIITDEGLFISDMFLSWQEIQNARVEFFFKRPVHLVLEAKRGQVMRIQLTRFNIDRKQAHEIDSLVNQYVKRQE